jgi:hypothetical protein
LQQVAERHLGPIADQRYSFGDAGRLEALLREAGFHDVRVTTQSRTIRFQDGAPFLRLNTMALVDMSRGGKTMAEEERKRVLETIISESAPVLRRYADGPSLAFELSANLATAQG